jgi:hypothetical protein
MSHKSTNRIIESDRDSIPGREISVSLDSERDLLILPLGTAAFSHHLWLLSSVPALASREWRDEEGPVEGEMVWPLCKWFWTSEHFKKSFSWDEPPSSFLVSPHSGPCHDNDPHAGISIFSFIEDQVHRCRNLSLSSPHLGPFWDDRMAGDNIPCLQKIHSKAEGVGSSMDRRDLPFPPLFSLFYRTLINWNSASSLSIPLASVGTDGLDHNLDLYKNHSGTKWAENFFLNLLVAPCLSLLRIFFLYLFGEAVSPFFLSS